MNLQEYTIFLQQQKDPKLNPDEIVAKVEEWKKNNPQPEVEEEVDIDEQPVDTKNEVNGEVKDDPYSIRSSSKILSDEPVNLSSTTQQTGMSLGELNTKLEPEEQLRQEQKEAWDALTVVAKPNETHEANGFEFQYELSDTGKPIYRRRKKGVDEWETLDPEAGGEQQDAYYAVSGVFGHTTIDGGLMLSQNKVISNASKKSQSLTNELILESKTITDDANVIDPKFAEVATIFEEKIKLTPEEDANIVLYEDNVPVSGEAVDWWTDDQEIDETKKEQYIDPYSKTGNVRTRTVKTGKKIPNPDWVEARDAAISQIVSEEGKSPEQLNIDSPEMQERIKNKMISNKAIALKDELELDKLEDFIESEPSGFTWKKLAMWIGGGPVGSHLDATDVWSRSEKQQMMELFKKDKLSKLTTQQKSIGSFIDKSATTLKVLKASAEAIRNQEYQTPNQIVQANKALQEINNQKNQIFDLIKAKYNELDASLEESKDASAAINDLERNYSVIPIMIHNAENAAIDMGQGLETLAFKVANLPNDIAFEIDESISKRTYDKTHGDGAWDKLTPEEKKKNTKSVIGNKFTAFNPFWGLGYNYAMEGWSDTREKAHAAIDKYQENLMSGIAESMTMDDLKDASDWGRYIFATGGSIAPQMGVIVATGGYGVGIVTAQAGGSRFMQYENEMKQNAKEREIHEKNKPVKRKGETDEAFNFRMEEWKKAKPPVIDYNLTQMWGGALTSMGAEYVGGRYIALPMVNRAKAFKGYGVKAGFTKEFGKKFLTSTYGYTGDLVTEGLEEVFAEGVGNLYDRVILGKDVNVFDGWKDNFFSGLMMANGFKSPALFNVFSGAVQTPGDQMNIKNSQNLIKNKINLIQENPEMSPDTKQLLNDDIADETLKINNTLTAAHNRYNNMPREVIDELGKNEQATFRLNQQIEAVTNDKGIKVGKEQLLEDLNNKKNELTGEKNRILEPYVNVDAEGQVTGGNLMIAPETRQIQEGSEAVVDQLGDADIVRFDNSQDFLGGVETLREQGVEVDLAEDADGNILPAEQQGYGLIVTLPNGTKQIVINNASSEADGVPPADKHEVLHLFASKMNPDKLSKMGEDLYNTLINDRGITGRIEIDPRTRKTLEVYKKQYDDGDITKEHFYEEVMAVTSDGLTRKGIKVKDTGPFLNLVNTFLEAIGYKQSFKDGEKALDFLKAFNKDVMSGEGLSQDTLDAAGVTETVETKKIKSQSEGDTSDYDSAMRTYQSGDLGGGRDGTSTEKDNLVNASKKLSDKQKAEKQQEFLDNPANKAEVDDDGNVTVYRVGSIREGTQTPMTTDKSIAEIIAKERADQGLSSDITKTKVNKDDVSVWVGGVEAEVIVDVNSDNINNINDKSSIEQESEVDIQAELDVVNEALDNINKDLESDKDLDFDRSILEDAKKKNERKKKNLEKQLERQKTKKSEKPEVSLTGMWEVGNKFKQGETEDGETPAETKKKSEKNFMDFHKSNYKRESESVLNDPDVRYAPGPLDGIVALDKQLAKIVRDSGEKSVYSWYWQNDGNDNHQEIYQEIESRKEKVKQLALKNSVNELRAKLKDAKGKNKEDIKLAIQETFKVLPAAVRDSEIDIYTGKPLKPVKRSEKVKEPLDAINDLIPSNIKTKDQFDKFIGDNRSALKIAQALDPGGVIHNYIRSRETSREQGDKMLDEVRLRMFNFDPEAVRADGTVVGPEGFGESIFANTRFAKMVANKDLVKEGETRKSTKSIDSEGFVEPTTSQEKSKKDTKPKQKRKSQLPRETTKFTTNFASNLNIDTKGKSDKQIQEEVQKQFDEAIAKDLEAMPVKTFGETRNIGPAVAALMEKATGMPAKVFTDKSQNIQKKDADSGALTAVKQYLYNNAQRDFNNLPDAFDTATGKANFIPENIKREFYKKDSKGKFILDKSKGLKDYQDLLGDMDKPVYRASEAQTIKGLIGLSLRNRIFEQAVPDPVARKTTGVKFSEKVKLTKDELKKNSEHKLETEKGYNDALKEAAQLNDMRQVMKMLGVPMETINDKNRKTIVDNFVKEIETNPAIISSVLTALNLSNFGARNLTSKDWRTKQGADGPSIKERNEWNAFEEGNKIVENAKYYRIDLGVDADGNNKYTFMIAPEIGLDKTKVNQLLKKTNPKTGKKYTLKYIKENKHSLGVVKYARASAAGFKEKMENEFGEKVIQDGKEVKLDPPPPSFVPARGGMFWGKKDRNYEKAEKLAKKNDTKTPENEKAVKAINAVKRIKIDDKGNYIIPRGINPKTKKAWTKADIDKINQEGRNALLNQLTKAVEDGMPFETLAMLVNKGYQGTGAIFKISIPFVGKSTIILEEGGLTDRARIKLAKEGGPYSEVTTEEHSPPVSVNMGQYMVGQARDIVKSDKDGKFTTKEALAIQEAIDENAVQVLIDAATDAAMNEKGFKSKIVEGQTIKTKNVAWNRINEGNHDGNPSPLEKIELEEGGTAADKTGITPKVQFSKKFKNNPSALNYQQKLIKDNALDPEALNTKDAKDKLNISMPVQVLKNDQVIKNSELDPDIMVKTMTAEKMKTVMVNSFKTRVEANKIKKERKGISVFDFDDTLAETKEKVIVLNSDGSITEISASQFAKDAAKLIEQGAEFDFSNFENVAKETKEGPLADLARKRQGKFGSGDIFVLTARPNTAGPAIKAFLKSIGINIPLKNITGLSDGTPQAKVDWVLNKTGEGYNDFYFADDSFANVAGVKAVLDAVDVKNKVQQAKVKKSEKLSDELNDILEEVTGIGKFKRYSNVRARLEGVKKDGGLTKRVANQFTITPSADDFIGLTYAFRGEGEQGNKHTKWIEDNLIKPYNKAELELMSAKITVADDFAALRKQFPSLKTTRNKIGVLQNPLHAEIGVGPYTKSQAIRVYMWNKQGMEIPGMSKRDINALVKAVENDNELNVFADEVILIQKGKSYPAPGKNWLAGDIKSDILNGLDKGFRKKLMTEFSENADIIFSPENLNKLEALFGSKYREALVDSLRRMKTGSNRPQYDGPGSRIVNDMLDWLNASVGVTMFLNRKSGLLQMLSTVNFINWGDNNLYAASKAFASKDFYPTFMRLMNSPYLVNRRDGLKINVNEAELVDRGRKDGFQGLVSYLLDKGFIFTRIADSLAIATGGATFFINRKKALLNRVNPETGKKYTEAEADTKAFDDFYAIAEETQQSSNPSRISQQQASMAGRVFLSFQNVTMQFNRKTKKSILDFIKRRKRPGMTQRESDMSNLSNVVYYVGMQNLIFHSLQQALFAGLFGEDEEEEKDKNKTFDTANSMVDSLLFGLGFGGAIVSTIKNVAMRIYDESQTKSPDYEDPLWDLFDVSPVIDSKVRKLRQAAKSFSWNMKEIKRRGWSLDNPAYLAVSQIVSAFFNVPMDNLMNMMNAGSNIMDNEVRMWQKIALSLGWSPYILGLPYWGRQSTIDREAKEDEQLKIDYAKAVKNVKAKGFTKKIPLSGPNHYIPKGELGVDYMQVERIDGTIQYYVKHKK